MHLKDLNGKRIIILGFGREGRAVLKTIEDNGISADITIADKRVRNLSANGRQTPLARLEAAEIGSIRPGDNEDRIIVTRDQLPDLLVQALIAVEDRGFYRHHGIDPAAILRAAWVNLRAGDIRQGGSTLTQQLVKNYFLTDERTLTRKINEALMAILLDLRYGKDEILEAYANEIYLGQDGQRAIHGFGLASYHYFNLPLSELDLPQLALLAALVRGPSWYDPLHHPERALQRRNHVIGLLQEQGIIDARQAQSARQAGLGLKDRTTGGRPNVAAFMSVARRQLQRDYREQDLSSAGLRIFTTLDPWLQRQAARAVDEGLDGLESGHRLPSGRLQAAAIVVSRDDGEILAVIGGRGYRHGGFNRAIEAVRPIGSLVKPAVYLTALMQPQRHTLATLLRDEPIELDTPQGRWQPANYDHESHGRVLLIDALSHSYNLATIRLGLELGLDQVAGTLRRLGVTRKVPEVPAMLIGALAMTPLEVAQMYQTIAAGGFRTPLRAIREVQTADGALLRHYPLEVVQAVPPAPVYLLNRALQEVVTTGTARSLTTILSAGLGLAGKTGTTNELRDSWFAGFGGDKLAVVWLGRDDNRPAGLSGPAGALRVWGDMMRRSGIEPLTLVRPDNVDTAWVERDSGRLSGAGCANAMQLPFIHGSAPDEKSSCIDDDLLHKLFRNFLE